MGQLFDNDITAVNSLNRDEIANGSIVINEVSTHSICGRNTCQGGVKTKFAEY